MQKYPTILVLVLLFIFAAPVYSQNTADLYDPLYKDLDIWEAAGFTDPLPDLQPWPVNVIIKSLEQVARNGDSRSRQKADYYLGVLEGKYRGHVTLLQDGFYTTRDDSFSALSLKLEMQVNPYENLYAVGWVEGAFTQSDTNTALPKFTAIPYDRNPDWSDMDIFGKNYLIRQGFNGLTTFGAPEFYAISGLTRSSFGPFRESSAVLSREAQQAGHFSYTLLNRFFNVSFLFLEISASNDYGAGRFTEKYLVFHSVKVHPFDWLEASFFESIVYGGRLEPLYFIPFSEFFYSQGTIGFQDNALMGVGATLKLPESIRIPFLVYIDDLHFNDLVRFDFDTKYKLAAQAGVYWTPMTSIIRQARLEYLAVMPYMYTHNSESIDRTMPNYLNYTHRGRNLGPDMDPNTDRLSINLHFEPLSFLNIDLFGKFYRHGNGSVDGSVNVGDGDGSLFDDGYADDGTITFQHTTRFMRQDVLEKTLHIGFNVDYTFPPGLKDSAIEKNLIKAGVLHAKLGYVFENITNLDLGDQNRRTHYFDFSFSYTY